MFAPVRLRGSAIHAPPAVAASAATDNDALRGFGSHPNASSSSTSRRRNDTLAATSPSVRNPPIGLLSAGVGPSPGARFCGAAPSEVISTRSDDALTTASAGRTQTRRHGVDAAGDAPLGAHTFAATKRSTGPTGDAATTTAGGFPGSTSTRAGKPHADPSDSFAAIHTVRRRSTSVPDASRETSVGAVAHAAGATATNPAPTASPRAEANTSNGHPLATTSGARTSTKRGGGAAPRRGARPRSTVTANRATAFAPAACPSTDRERSSTSASLVFGARASASKSPAVSETAPTHAPAISPASSSGTSSRVSACLGSAESTRAGSPGDAIPRAAIARVRLYVMTYAHAQGSAV